MYKEWELIQNCGGIQWSNGKGEVRVQVKRQEGSQFTKVDIRSWFLPDDADEMRPTQKGVMIDAEEVDALIALLQAAKGAASAQETADPSPSNEDLPF